jgi:transketolase
MSVGESMQSMAGSEALALEIRKHAVRMASCGGSSHLGSVLSCADALAVLYADTLRTDPLAPDWPDRDRFILSKGHAGSGVYAVLAERGFFPREWLRTHYQNGSLLSGHVSHKGIPGVEVSTGSLGHGLAVGAGMALGAKLAGASWRTFVLMSDGECDEGSVWEAALFASHHRLTGLVAIIDYNKIQSLARVSETIELEPFEGKWDSFGWGVERLDGHDHGAMTEAFRRVPLLPSRPSCFLLDTTKGKGVSFMEDSVLWHYRSPRGEEFTRAMNELGANE